MAMTIKQAADTLGVSKETIRRKLHTFPADNQAQYFYKVQQGNNTVIQITDAGLERLTQTDIQGNIIVAPQTDTSATASATAPEAPQGAEVLENQERGACGTTAPQDQCCTNKGTTAPQTDERRQTATETDKATQLYIDSLLDTIAILKAQVAEKDNQLDTILKQNSMTLAAYLKPQLEAEREEVIEQAPIKKRTFWEWLTGK